METENISSLLSQKEATSAWMQEIAPFAILTTDNELRVRGWNQWLITHSSLRAEEVIGRSLVEVFPELKSRKLIQYFERALKGEVSVLSSALHTYLLPLPGTVREQPESKMLQTARIAPLFSGTDVLGTITIIEDVSQREFQAEILRRQHSRERLLSRALATLLKASDPVAEMTALFAKVREELDLEGAINSEASLGVAVDTETNNRAGTERRIILLNRIQQSDDHAHASLRAAGIASYVAFPLMMGDLLWGTLSFASRTKEVIPTSDVEFLSTLAQYVAIAIERSSRESTLREAERILRNHAEVLEATVAERTRRLQETISQIESFSYSVAHDLRAPIRALKGYCDVLEEDFRKQMPEEAGVLIQRLSRSAGRLDALTRDLLKFSHLSLQEVDVQEVDLSNIVDEIIYLNPAFQNGRVSVQGPLGRVRGQSTLVHQCISNLLDNALKFAQPGRPLHIVISSKLQPKGKNPSVNTKAPFNPATLPAGDLSATDAKWTSQNPNEPDLRRRLLVEDNGIGIPPESQEKIFGIFERLSETNVEGTGIGLAIVSRAMQRMGGACGVESTVGQGSRFWLEFHPVQG